MDLTSPATEAEVVSALDDASQRMNWHTQTEPLITRFRPDLILVDPSGTTFVVEVKFGQGATHFGSLAQLDTVRDAYQTHIGANKVRAVMVTDVDVDDSFKLLANQTGIQIISTHDLSGDVGNGIIGKLESSESAGT
jgi:hypothetical protein